MNSRAVSVVVPVFNRAADIERCIEALLLQDYPAYEIIVVDNGSTDGTREVVSRYPATLLVEPHRNPYRARNRGIRAAAGEIIAFTDSDCAPAPTWLSRLVEAYDCEAIAGVGGSLSSLPPTTLVETFLALGRLQIVEGNHRADMQRDPYIFLSGGMGSANMSYRRSVFDALGGFDERYERFCGSYDFCWRVQQAGYRVVYEPAAHVQHHMRSSVRAMCRQFFEFGIGQIHLLRMRGEGFSYVQLKTYVLPRREWRCRLPVIAWLIVDACLAIPVLAVMALVWPALWWACLALAVFVFLGAARAAHAAVKQTQRPSWYVLFPALHLVRIYAQTAGRIAGGLRYGVLAL